MAWRSPRPPTSAAACCAAGLPTLWLSGAEPGLGLQEYLAPIAERSIRWATAPIEAGDDHPPSSVPTIELAPRPGTSMSLNCGACVFAGLALVLTTSAHAQSLSGVLRDSLL
jgi:hypothetical protein